MIDEKSLETTKTYNINFGTFFLKNYTRAIVIILSILWFYLIYTIFTPLSDTNLEEFVSESSCHYRNAKEELESNSNSISKFISWNIRMICYHEKKEIEEAKLISKQIRLINEVNKEKKLDYDFERIPLF